MHPILFETRRRNRNIIDLSKSVVEISQFTVYVVLKSLTSVLQTKIRSCMARDDCEVKIVLYGILVQNGD